MCFHILTVMVMLRTRIVAKHVELSCYYWRRALLLSCRVTMLIVMCHLVDMYNVEVNWVT